MQDELEKINGHLQSALTSAQAWETKLQSEELDSDLHRKLSFYLIPSLNHWITGAQAGSMKDLEELFKRREQK